MEVNLNDRVRVTLTKEGADYLNAVAATKPARFRGEPYVAGAVRTFQLWELMKHLGPQMGMLTAPLVVDNTFEIVRPS